LAGIKEKFVEWMIMFPQRRKLQTAVDLAEVEEDMLRGYLLVLHYFLENRDCELVSHWHWPAGGFYFASDVAPGRQFCLSYESSLDATAARTMRQGHCDGWGLLLTFSSQGRTRGPKKFVERPLLPNRWVGLPIACLSMLEIWPKTHTVSNEVLRKAAVRASSLRAGAIFLGTSGLGCWGARAACSQRRK